MDSTTPFAEKAIAILRDYVERHHRGNVSAASIALGIDPATGTFHKWLRTGSGSTSARYPGLERLGPVLDKIGAKLLGPDESPAQCAAPLGEEARKTIETLRRERDEARGAVAVLEKILERQAALLAGKGAESPAQSSPSRSARTG